MSSHIISEYFPNLTPEQKQQFEALFEIYAELNSKINVISRKDISYFYERHVLHSLGIAKVKSFEPGSAILDVGTGGGFPGIPLAIMFPNSKFHLIDSIAKKISVVNEVIKSVNLTNTTAERIRAEEHKMKYDYIVSRAVARMISFYRWTNHNIKQGGKIFYLKGGDIHEEMKEVGLPYKIHDLGNYYKEEFFKTKKVAEVSF